MIKESEKKDTVRQPLMVDRYIIQKQYLAEMAWHMIINKEIKPLNATSNLEPIPKNLEAWRDVRKYWSFSGIEQ
jgi:hypothetical protein